MIDVKKYIDLEYTEKEIEEAFSSDTLKKCQHYQNLFYEERSSEDVLAFLEDSDASMIMSYFINHNIELFYYLENEAKELGLKKGKVFLDFDWEVKPGLSFVNYYFFKNYHKLYVYDYSSRTIRLDKEGYALSLLAYSSFKPWKIGDLPFGKLMKKDFYQDEYQELEHNKSRRKL